MIDSLEKAIAVQQRRRAAGKRGRAKAVRRWFKRTYGRAVEAHPLSTLPDGVRELWGDFAGCRSFEESREPVLVQVSERLFERRFLEKDIPGGRSVHRCSDVLATADRIIAKYAKTLDNLSNR